jgi:uncharacterized protein YjbI with pentapeptide repeats
MEPKKLRISDDPMYQLLRAGNLAEFNRKKAAGDKPDLTACDFRNLDLRGIDADGLDFSDCYFRQADLRGIDFRGACLEGASLNGAQVSGAYFPKGLSAEEIKLSVELGTRLRYST